MRQLNDSLGITIVSVLTGVFGKKKQGRENKVFMSGGLSLSGRLSQKPKDKNRPKLSRAARWAKTPQNNGVIAGAQERGGDEAGPRSQCPFRRLIN